MIDSYCWFICLLETASQWSGIWDIAQAGFEPVVPQTSKSQDFRSHTQRTLVNLWLSPISSGSLAPTIYTVACRLSWVSTLEAYLSPVFMVKKKVMPAPRPSLQNEYSPWHLNFLQTVRNCWKFEGASIGPRKCMTVT